MIDGAHLAGGGGSPELPVTVPSAAAPAATGVGAALLVVSGQAVLQFLLFPETTWPSTRAWPYGEKSSEHCQKLFPSLVNTLQFINNFINICQCPQFVARFH